VAWLIAILFFAVLGLLTVVVASWPKIAWVLGAVCLRRGWFVLTTTRLVSVRWWARPLCWYLVTLWKDPWA